MEKRIPVEEGKYTFIKTRDDYRITVLRYGEEWLTIEEGHNAINALMDYVVELEETISRTQKAVKALEDGLRGKGLVF